VEANGFPSPSDVRAFLKGYGLDVESTLSLTGTLTMDSPVVTEIDTTKLEVGFYISGSGIPAYTKILTVDVLDPVAGQITLDDAATATGSKNLTFTYYDAVTDGWLSDVRDNEVKPFLERVCRQKFDGIETVTEYYDGTGSSILALRRRPIIRVVSLSYTNVDSNLYYLSPTAMQVIADEGILKAKANFNESTYTPIFWKGQRNLRVIYQVGWATCPNDVAQAVKYLIAEAALGHVADMTGGGSLSTNGYSKDYGKRGRYTNARNSLARRAHAILRKYMTGTN